MIKQRILDKNQVVVKKQFGTVVHQWNGEKINIYRSMDCMNIFVEYKEKIVCWSVKDMIKKSIELIDGEDLKEELVDVDSLFKA